MAEAAWDHSLRRGGSALEMRLSRIRMDPNFGAEVEKTLQ
jgi:hypothetical protein